MHKTRNHIPKKVTVSMTGKTQGVSRRKVTEAALRESEARLRLAVHSANIGPWDWDMKTNEVIFSPEWKGQIGYRDEELSNRFEEWQSRVHPDDLESALQKLQAYLANPQGAHEVEFRFRHKDGSYRWIHSQGDVLRDAAGKPIRMLGCHIDITEHKRAEDLLARSRDRFNEIISAATDAIISIDGEQRIVLFNPAAEKMFGVPAQEAVGTTIHRFIPARFRAGHAGHVANFGKTGVSPRHMGGLSSVSGIRSNGEEFPIDASISKVEISGERLFTVILRDITERTRAEEALRQSEQRLRLFLDSPTRRPGTRPCSLAT